MPVSSGFSPNSRISLPQQLPPNFSSAISSPYQSNLKQSGQELATINEQPDQEARISATNQPSRQSLNPLEGMATMIKPSPV